MHTLESQHTDLGWASSRCRPGIHEEEKPHVLRSTQVLSRGPGSKLSRGGVRLGPQTDVKTGSPHSLLAGCLIVSGTH